jgi:hypothetical protein
LITQWSGATFKLKDDLIKNLLPQYCNGCCHKFSKNMYASIIKYPLSNRVALGKVLLLIISRALTKTYKHIFINK